MRIGRSLTRTKIYDRPPRGGQGRRMRTLLSRPRFISRLRLQGKSAPTTGRVGPTALVAKSYLFGCRRRDGARSSVASVSKCWARDRIILAHGPLVWAQRVNSRRWIGKMRSRSGFRSRHLSADHGDGDFFLLAARASLAIDHADLIRAIRSQIETAHCCYPAYACARLF
jgi:hypothetical protein